MASMLFTVAENVRNEAQFDPVLQAVLPAGRAFVGVVVQVNVKLRAGHGSQLGQLGPERVVARA